MNKRSYREKKTKKIAKVVDRASLIDMRSLKLVKPIEVISGMIKPLEKHELNAARIRLI